MYDQSQLANEHPYWGFDGPQQSGFCLNDSFGVTIVGSAVKDDNGQWVAFDNREANDHHTEARKLGTCSTREEAKNLIENAFKPPEPPAGNPEPSRDFMDEIRSRVRDLTTRPEEKNDDEKCGDSLKVEG